MKAPRSPPWGADDARPSVRPPEIGAVPEVRPNNRTATRPCQLASAAIWTLRQRLVRPSRGVPTSPRSSGDTVRRRCTARRRIALLMALTAGVAGHAADARQVAPADSSAPASSTAPATDAGADHPRLAPAAGRTRARGGRRGDAGRRIRPARADAASASPASTSRWPDPIRITSERLEVRLHLPDLQSLTADPADPASAEALSSINVALAPGRRCRGVRSRISRRACRW